jgi:hypothetical protein
MGEREQRVSLRRAGARSSSLPTPNNRQGGMWLGIPPPNCGEQRARTKQRAWTKVTIDFSIESPVKRYCLSPTLQIRTLRIGEDKDPRGRGGQSHSRAEGVAAPLEPSIFSLWHREKKMPIRESRPAPDL